MSNEVKKTRFDISIEDTGNTSEWKDALAHQIETKMKVVDQLRLTPVIFGRPNVDVKSAIFEIANQYDMRFITINLSTYSVNDIATKLYEDIISNIKLSDEVYMSNLSVSEINLYTSNLWKYLIYFDNINCAESINFYSAIRGIFYEKRFPNGQIFPEQSILIGRMSQQEPGDVELNSYLRDVLTIIPYSD